MKFCSKCGKEIMDEAVICPNCGCSVSSTEKELDAPSTGFAVLGFFIPLIGMILYLVLKDKMPLKAKSAGKGALIGVCVSVVLGIIWGVILGSLIGTLLGEMSYYYY